ncbi:Alpha/Beta hydrolase protein [Talaromyces proteolyticus]|uniref:Alpha/Beta hydrolase protein n=1 Tax=Talaromyces proteolyticus TaxID=1131652 RepID=A0AAD4L0V8_9EURO|nr:Alpha/Beta hydrolase protein [Talaromyces proteolyticus]KAH8705029.1 Alpha/Beta hydrolase protein [Talaromyces proteolyticus]
MDDTPKPRFRTDNNSSQTFILPDGRSLGYAQYGALTGKPILYQHGHPASRLEAAGFDDLGLELGARIIAMDRPGFGWSSPHPGRKLLDHPKDIEHLANHLGLDHYSVLGISGGGPYALACAAALPAEKLRCVSIVCGMGPPDIGMKGADFIHKLGFAGGYRYTPMSILRWFAKWFWSRDLAGRLDLSDEKRLELLLQQPIAHEKDADFLKTDWPRLYLRSTRESFAQGFDAIAEDGKVMCMDLGFKIEDIRPDLPVQLWYGKFDTFVPPNHGVQIAARLGNRAHLKLEDETHGSIVVNCIREVFEDLLSSS